ncbi:MAG: preprotein translocase subunit YajC [Oscillospiraceae bacterium]|nr:preprotein translocase subunit YajC [Oscillospiraceae bacterium]
MTILLIVAMVAVFYFLIIRPQRKRDKEAKDMRDSIRVGDEITTIGGIVGKVCNVKEDRVTVVSGESKMTFLKSAIASVTSAETELGQ